MVGFGTGRMLGLIGSIIIILASFTTILLGLLDSTLPGLTTDFLILFLYLLGLILILVPLHAFSKVYGERVILRNALLSVLIGYGAISIAYFLLLPRGFTIKISETFFKEISTSLDVFRALGYTFFGIILAGLLPQVLAFSIASSVAFVVSAILWYRALNALSLKSGEGLFRRAGLLLLASTLSFITGAIATIILTGLAFLAPALSLIIGVIATIILLIGAISYLISFAVLAIAFYAIKPPQPPSTQAGASLTNI